MNPRPNQNENSPLVPDSISQEDLDWFVEGEVSLEERDEWFSRLDKSSDGWKRFALALLEQKALHRALSLPVPEKPESLISPVKEGDIVCASKNEREPTVASNQRTFKSGYWVAASLMACLFCLGYWLGDQRNDSAPIANAASTIETGHQNEGRNVAGLNVNRVGNLDPMTIAKVNAAVARVSVQDQRVIAVVSFKHHDRDLVLPVIESAQLQRSWAELPQPAVPYELAKKIRESGYVMQPNRQFLSLHEKDGSKQVRAFNMLDCHFIGKSIF